MVLELDADIVLPEQDGEEDYVVQGGEEVFCGGKRGHTVSGCVHS